MPKKPDKPGGEAQTGKQGPAPEQDADQERPTVAPPFDPAKFAKELSGTPSPAQGTPVRKPAPSAHTHGTPKGLGAIRPPSPTLTNEDDLETARKLSSQSNPAPRRKTPAGALSLANARFPSNLPPVAREPGPQRKPSATMGAVAPEEVDREWEELATSPPPPLQDELIASMARRESTPAEKREEEKAKADEGPPTEQEMSDRVALGDYTGALAIAEKLLAIDPNHDSAKACAENCRTVLKQMYTARIGTLDRVPVVMVARDQLRWLSIDHRAGFVLSLIDGVSSLEAILDVTGMPQLDALRILAELAQQRIISFR